MTGKTGLFLNVRDPGGPFAAAFRSAYFEPFEQESGIRINQLHGGTEPAEMMQEMVDNRTYEWDVALTSRATNLALMSGERPYLDPIDIKSASLDLVPPEYKDEYFAGDHVYANVLAYRADTFEHAVRPESWRDFWDAARFKARRSLRNFPMDTMEEALLADGVHPDMLYPLDSSRAFESLARIRPHIDHWWTKGDEQAPLLTEGRVDMCAISSLRAIHARKLGAPVEIAWNQNIRTINGWGILKGTPRLAIAREFVRFAVDARRQAAMAGGVAVSPAIPDAAKYLTAERLRELPDAFRLGAVEYDAAYWCIHKQPMIAKFESWFRSP